MRIALFHDLPSGGAKRVIEAHARHLRAMGHEVAAFLPSTADETFLPLTAVLGTVHRFERPQPPDRSRLLGSASLMEPARWLRYLGAVRATEREIARIIDGSEYDVALVHPSQFTQAPCLLRYLRTPSLYYCHEPLRAAYEPWFAPPWLRHALRHTLGRLDASNVARASSVAVNSRYTASRVEAIYDRSAEVAYPGIDWERFKPAGVTRERFVLVVGALHRSKGLEFVLDAIAEVPREQRPPLVVVSDRVREDERRRLRARAGALEVELTLQHRVNEDDLIMLYSRAAAVVYAPHQEPLGLVPLEAMACEAPVLGIDEGGVSETIVDGVTGLLAPRDRTVFASGLRALLDRPQWAATLGKQGRASVVENWNWRRSIEQLERLCRETARGEAAIQRRQA